MKSILVFKVSMFSKLNIYRVFNIFILYKILHRSLESLIIYLDN